MSYYGLRFRDHVGVNISEQAMELLPDASLVEIRRNFLVVDCDLTVKEVRELFAPLAITSIMYPRSLNIEEPDNGDLPETTTEP